jgi:hypothetical protein
VIEWAEKWFGEAPGSQGRAPGVSGLFRRVKIENLSETERRISYEDFGA